MAPTSKKKGQERPRLPPLSLHCFKLGCYDQPDPDYLDWLRVHHPESLTDDPLLKIPWLVIGGFSHVSWGMISFLLLACWITVTQVKLDLLYSAVSESSRSTTTPSLISNSWCLEWINRLPAQMDRPTPPLSQHTKWIDRLPLSHLLVAQVDRPTPPLSLTAPVSSSRLTDSSPTLGRPGSSKQSICSPSLTLSNAGSSNS